MMKSRVIYLFLLASVLLACAGPEARKPIVRKTSSFMNESIERNKVLNNLEFKLLEAKMQRDSLSEYKNSSQGFWYKYLVEMEDKGLLPETGDVVLFEHQIKDLRDSIVYSKEELGVKSYLVDKEEMISGLQDGIKLMAEGEEVVFLFPSHKAYGYLGNERIEANQPLIYEVKLLKITKE